MYKVSMVSLGCPKNQVDAEQMLYTLQNAGFELTPAEAEADRRHDLPDQLRHGRWPAQ